MKKTSKKAVKTYTVTAKENEDLKKLASNDFTVSEVFAKFAEDKTGIKRQAWKTTGKSGHKKTVAIKPTRNAAYVAAMRKLKATLKPYWIEAGYTAKRYNVRYSQLINIVYGQPMQVQVKQPIAKADGGQYTVDIDGKAWQAEVRTLIRALISKHSKADVTTVIDVAINGIA